MEPVRELVLGARPSHLLAWMAVGVVIWSAIFALAISVGAVGLESLG